MKYLTLARHAKSSWKDPALADIDRPLNGRGKKNGPDMARRLVRTGCRPDLVLSSPARRARDTAVFYAEAWELDVREVRFEPSLYGAGRHELLDAVHAAPEACRDLLLVGHNPGLTEFANFLAPCRLDNIVTCGLVRLVLDVSAWRDVGSRCARMLFYDYPKNPVCDPGE